jgi:hypothetical protein
MALAVGVRSGSEAGSEIPRVRSKANRRAVEGAHRDALRHDDDARAVRGRRFRDAADKVEQRLVIMNSDRAARA